MVVRQHIGVCAPFLIGARCDGNGGPTAWWNGRIVGGWYQDADARVQLQLLEDPGRDGKKALQRRADELTAWAEGVRVSARFPSPLSKSGATVTRQPIA